MLYYFSIYHPLKFIAMKSNVGSKDKLIRLAIAIAIIILFYLNVFSEIVGLVLLGFALVLSITSLIGFCPLYRVFGISSCKNTNVKKQE
jgi:hypothetical protein